ncbi:putative secreted protein [Corynebacterium kutscheri]|uniref:Secreted protein n=1 Tax=Corynebacterium kutscheri TaxID=35755 RepID=A0A0F6TDH7_9CORY|nr:hypothetical protein [Corynebacterium kutscheri]AKE41729.1 hypothetical protein UL82_07840 [Corynebacterium kutscheri]VEH09005.1 putative secreted protein [Corynebacterium kutscheri]VEH10056.1 putative secreted protein [Corynebacterium kutscheri]VEH80137.1 putative secreted protein [Corynebacterium kutscheri]
MRRFIATVLSVVFSTALAAQATVAATALPLSSDVELPYLSSPALPVDELGRPSPEILHQARLFADTLPAEARTAVLSAVAFFEGTGGGVALPETAPMFAQFLWPTVSGSCIGGTHDSLGSGIAVPGPTKIPLPGAQEGETAFLFTALGTSAAAKEQNMNVHWFNLYTLKWGSTALGHNGINTDGPATISGTAPTGKGRIIALLEGTVHTQDAHCRFLPTVASFEVK